MLQLPDVSYFQPSFMPFLPVLKIAFSTAFVQGRLLSCILLFYCWVQPLFLICKVFLYFKDMLWYFFKLYNVEFYHFPSFCLCPLSLLTIPGSLLSNLIILLRHQKLHPHPLSKENFPWIICVCISIDFRYRVLFVILSVLSISALVCLQK